MKKLTWIKLGFVQVVAWGLAAAAFFGFRCPAQGCPACKMLGQ